MNGLRNIAYAITVMIICSWATASTAQTVSATLDTNAYRIGEYIPLHLEAVVPTGTAVLWPVIDTEIEGMEVLDRTEIDSSTKAEQTTYSQELTLMVFDSGYYPVPAFQFIIDSDTLSTIPSLLQVSSVPIDTTVADIKPIKDILEQPVTFREILPWLLLGIGILLIILVIILLAKKKQPKAIVAPPEPQVVPHEWALEAMHALKAEGLWQEGNIKLYFSRLTDIFRRYIELRYKQPAMESTTDEIMDRMKLLSLDIDLTEQIRSTLILSDLVKFAKSKPVANECEQSFDVVLKFIQQTKQEIPKKEEDVE